MKKLLPIIVLFLIWHHAAEAQWHMRTCGVPDIELASAEEFECLWQKANTVSKVGKISFAVGAGLMAIGGITMLITDPCCSSGTFLAGALSLEAMVVVVAISIPIWAVGNSRLSKLRASQQYQGLQRGSLELSPMISANQLNRQMAPGVALIFRF